MKKRKKKIHIHLSNRWLYTLIALGIILIVIVGVYAAVDTSREWHPANSIVLKIDGTDRTLQYALTNNLLTGAHTYAAPSSIPIGNHSAENIWVYTDSVKTLLVALQSSSYGLCRTSASPSYSESGVGHTAREVKADSANSFQEAIDARAFCCVPDCTGKVCGLDPVCGTSCGTCTAPKDTCFNDGTICCASTYGATCGGDICINAGTYNCDGICEGTSNKADETSCGAGKWCQAGQCVDIPTYSWYVGAWDTTTLGYDGRCIFDLKAGSEGLPENPTAYISNSKGDRYRQVYCKRSTDGATVDDSYCSQICVINPDGSLSCSPSPKPVNTQFCKKTLELGGYIGCKAGWAMMNCNEITTDQYCGIGGVTWDNECYYPERKCGFLSLGREWYNVLCKPVISDICHPVNVARGECY